MENIGSVFGQKPVFGSFGSSTTQKNPFGVTFQQQSQPAFGSSLFGSSAPFGASSQPASDISSTPAFGSTSTPAFGATSSPTFGVTSAPAFGSTASPAFGSTGTAFGVSNASVFGSGGAFVVQALQHLVLQVLLLLVPQRVLHLVAQALHLVSQMHRSLDLGEHLGLQALQHLVLQVLLLLVVLVLHHLVLAPVQHLANQFLLLAAAHLVLLHRPLELRVLHLVLAAAHLVLVLVVGEHPTAVSPLVEGVVGQQPNRCDHRCGPTGAQATTPTFGSAGFGQAALGSQCGGSRVAAYTPIVELDCGSSTEPTGKLESISAMPFYKDKIHEELRWDDYQLGDKAGQSTGAIGNPFSSSTPSNIFAQKTPAFGGTGFGSSSPTFF